MMTPVSPPTSADVGMGHAHAPSQEEMEVDMSTVMLDDPIVGVEVVLSDHSGAGARPARPSISQANESGTKSYPRPDAPPFRSGLRDLQSHAQPQCHASSLS